jgi:CBS domain-containing protein
VLVQHVQSIVPSRRRARSVRTPIRGKLTGNTSTEEDMASDLARDGKDRREELQASLVHLEQDVEHGLKEAVSVAATKARDLARVANTFWGRHFGSRAELQAPVSRIMSSSPRQCAADDSLNRAAQIFWEADCGFLPVVGGDGKLLGVITDRDVCMAEYLKGGSLLGSNVGSAMTRSVYSCAPEHPIEHALSLMAAHRVRRLPVLHDDGTLAGIVALADVARYVHALHGDAVSAHAALGVTLARISERRGDSQPAARAAE